MLYKIGCASATVILTTVLITMTSAFNATKHLPVGCSNFTEMVKQRLHFVDKTLFLSGVVEFGCIALLIARPRRTGKTINLSMLQTFLDSRQDSKALFEKTNVAQYKKFCDTHQNKYPVLYISFSNFSSNTYEEAMHDIKVMMSDLYSNHNYLQKYMEPESIESNEFRDVLHLNVCDVKLQFSLHITQRITNYLGKKPYVLVDDYDKVYFIAYANKYLDKIRSFLDSFFVMAFTDNDVNIKKAVLTATISIVTGGLDNLLVDSMNWPIFPQSFGFTEEEVKGLLGKISSTLTIEKLKVMYGGHVIGKFNLYNPYSVIASLATDTVKPFWTDPGLLRVISKLMPKAKDADKRSFKALLSNRTVQKSIKEVFAFDNFRESDSLWTMLVQGGYLTAVFSHQNQDYFSIFNVSIPNLEMRYELNKIETLINTVSG